MIWEKFMSKCRGGQVTPLPLPGGAHEHTLATEILTWCVARRCATVERLVVVVS